MSAALVLAIILAVAVARQLIRADRPDERAVERWARDVVNVPAVVCLIASLLVIGDAGESRRRVRRSVRPVSA